MRSFRTSNRVMILLLAILGVGLAGCSQRLTPPTNVSDPARVFVIDYGKHASLALPDERGPGLVEWSWGDWNWFALGRTDVLSGARALFGSPQSTLSRRELGRASSAVELKQRLGATKVFDLAVERSRAASLNRQLEQRWSRRRSEAVSGQDGRVFVPDEARYSLGNNSVHELERWLRALGVKVSGGGVTANLKLQRR